MTARKRSTDKPRSATRPANKPGKRVSGAFVLHNAANEQERPYTPAVAAKRIILPFEKEPPSKYDGALKDTVAFLRWRFENPTKPFFNVGLPAMAEWFEIDPAFLAQEAKRDRYAHAAALVSAKGHVQRGEPVPEPLRPILAGEAAKPKARGPHPQGNWHRNRSIALAVLRLLPAWPVPVPGWPKKGQRPSAYKIVTDALASDDLGAHSQHLTPRAIEKVCLLFPDLFPPPSSKVPPVCH